MLRQPSGKNAIKRLILRINLELSTEPCENQKSSTDIDTNYTQYTSSHRIENTVFPRYEEELVNNQKRR